MSKTFVTPSKRVSTGVDLRVSFIPFSFGTNQTITELRIKVDEVNTALLPLADLPSAQLSINLAGVKSEGVVLWPEVPIGETLRLLSPDNRIVIGAVDPALGNDSLEFIFDGYPTIPEVAWKDDSISLTIKCTPLIFHLGQEKKAQVYGRWFKPSSDNDVVFIESLHCVFNKDAKPNRHKDLHTFAGNTNVPAFTFDGDPEAKYWTFADILYYLLIHYWKIPLGTEYPLSLQQGLDLCDSLVGLDPVPVTNSDDPIFKDLVKAQSEELVLQGMGLLLALTHWAQSAGCTFQQYTKRDGSNPVSEVLFSGNGDGGPWNTFGETDERSIRRDPDDSLIGSGFLGLEQYTSSRNRAPKEFLTANQVSQGYLLIDSANIATSASVIGCKPEKFEITIGKGSPANNLFKPGWVADSTFGDNLAVGATLDAKIESIKNIAATQDGGDLEAADYTMYQRYVRGVDSTISFPYMSVGRVWVLNETGEFVGGTYGRDTSKAQAIWGSSVYQDPFDFHVNCNVPKAINRATGERALKWFPRRRRLLKLISKRPGILGDETSKPMVLASWDSGTTWHEYPGNASFNEHQCAIILNDNNLAMVNCPNNTSDDEKLSVWQAIVEGKFRLAATCVVEGDNVVIGESSFGSPAVLNSRHQLLLSFEQFLFESRTGANSELESATGWTGDDRDDAEQAQSLANRFVSISQRKAISFHPIIPWLTKDWLPGDLCAGINPAGINFYTGDDYSRLPQVIKTLWKNSEAGQSTHLVFDDRRTDAKKYAEQ